MDQSPLERSQARSDSEIGRSELKNLSIRREELAEPMSGSNDCIQFEKPQWAGSTPEGVQVFNLRL